MVMTSRASFCRIALALPVVLASLLIVAPFTLSSVLVQTINYIVITKEWDQAYNRESRWSR